MQKVRSRLVKSKSAVVLIALASVSLFTGCATTSEDEGQGRDRPTGGNRQ